MIDLYNVYGECINSMEVPVLGMINTKAGLRDQATENQGPTACINSKEASSYLNQYDVIQAMHVNKQTSVSYTHLTLPTKA